MDIQVIAIDAQGRVSLKLSSKILTGASKLFQIVVLSLLNVPGKDVLDPDQGGGLPAMIGTGFDPNDQQELFGEVARRVNKTQKEIIENQVGSGSPPAERLKAIHIVSLAEGADIDTTDVTLRVVNELGQFRDVVL